MTFSPKAIEAAARAAALADLDEETREIIDLDKHMLLVCAHYEEIAVAALSAALAVDGVALQGWQPIESAPEETEILGFWQRRVHNGTDGLGVTIWRGGSWRSVDAPNQKYTAPTHWQPLPPPPAASDREERCSPPKEKP